MNYEDALQFIKECAQFGIKLGLERITEILRRLGNPEDQFRSIHIAGTNGKGSTAAMFDFVFQDAGYKTGRFTSPHLTSYRERFTVNGVKITKERLTRIVERIKPVLEVVSKEGFGDPTEFEVGTVIAFEFFAAEQVDVAIVEVGMGGRFDATNVLRPVLSVITHIDYDHQSYLGNSLAEIAFEKAGIIKAGIPVIIGVQKPEIESYLLQIADLRGSLVKLASDIGINKVGVAENGTEANYDKTCFGDIHVNLKLIGPHQALNCVNVLAGVELLIQTGYKITQTGLISGLRKAIWPARMERIDRVKPLKLYLDGAHNPDGVKALVQTIQLLYPGQKVDLLVGIQNNRPLPEMAAILAPIAARAIVTEVTGFKTATVTELGSYFEDQGVATVKEPLPEKALRLLLASANSVAVAAGSLYLIGLLRSILFPDQDS
jgi:dihydrofolate synthase/folylpolyglutamate synthase